MTKRNVVADMRRAGVPKSCWSTDCAAAGLSYINEWADAAAASYETREAKSNVYLHAKRPASAPDAIDRIYLHARQLVARGVPGKVITFSGLIQTLRREGTEEHPVDLYTLQGRGFIAIPVLPTYTKDLHTLREFDEALGFLATHLYEGGIFMASGSFNLTAKHNSGLPVEIDKLLFDSSLIMEVV